MMAGVISANVVVVALAHDVLHAGARGFGFLQSGWALGAVAGGLAALALPRQKRQGLLIIVLAILAVGHALFPYAGMAGRRDGDERRLWRLPRRRARC